jgi:hypothetical protein
MDADERDQKTRDRMTELALRFPSMRGAPGVNPWDPEKLVYWGAGGASSGERRTARFLLTVWNRYAEWEIGRFDIFEALNVWDLPHREAFLLWAADPWWP